MTDPVTTYTVRYEGRRVGETNDPDEAEAASRSGYKVTAVTEARFR